MPGKEATARIKINELLEAPTHRARFHPPLWPSVTTAIFIDKFLAATFLNLFNHIQVSMPLSPVLACYTRIRRTQCYRQSFGRPGQPPDQRLAVPAAIRETHFAQKALKMRLPTADHHLNPLKTNSLKPYDYELHTPDKPASPASATWPPPCDASCRKTPPDASQNLTLPPQPTEKSAFKGRRL